MKFKKNDLVRINYGKLMGVFGAEDKDELDEETLKVIDCRFATDGSVEYKLRGCYGWWKEYHLVAAHN